MSNKEAIRQFMNVIKSDLNRWFEESDLDVEDLFRCSCRLDP